MGMGLVNDMVSNHSFVFILQCRIIHVHVGYCDQYGSHTDQSESTAFRLPEGREEIENS